MSWPTDGKPRYLVVEVSGAFKASVGSSAALKHFSIHVLDRALNHRIVASFRTEHQKGYSVPSLVRAKATARCAELNAAGEAIAA